MKEDIGSRRKRGLSQAKAKVIAHEGLSKYGDGFASEKQKHYIGLIAGGGTPTRMQDRNRRKRRGRR